MKNTEIVTNEEVQNTLSTLLRQIDSGETDQTHAKVYVAGVRTMLSSVKIDLEGSKRLGLPMFDRTKKFLGVKE